MKNKWKKLNEEEKRVIENKGTEKPFTGEYNDNFRKGTYKCRRCGQELYRSEDKFHSGCGWPSFDDEIKGGVKRSVSLSQFYNKKTNLCDMTGLIPKSLSTLSRTEIICNNCGAHLGHVFENEGLTNKNIRHCVNSISLEFIPEEK